MDNFHQKMEWHENPIMKSLFYIEIGGAFLLFLLLELITISLLSGILQRTLHMGLILI